MGAETLGAHRYVVSLLFCKHVFPTLEKGFLFSLTNGRAVAGMYVYKAVLVESLFTSGLPYFHF